MGSPFIRASAKADRPWSGRLQPAPEREGFGAVDGQNASSGFSAARVVPIGRPFLTIDVAGSLRAAAACCAGKRSTGAEPIQLISPIWTVFISRPRTYIVI